MQQKITLEELIKLQVHHPIAKFIEYGDIQSFINQFEGIPNEACYILDCRTLDLHLAQNNFADVLGIPNCNPNKVTDLLTLIHEEHIQFVMNVSFAILSNECHFECGKDSVSLLYKINNGKMIMKTSTPLKMDSNRHVILVAEQFKDVSNLVAPAFKWGFIGPNAEKLKRLVSNTFKKDLPITMQELVVLRQIGKGCTSKEAAEVLSLSKHTVDTHRRNILKKLDVANTNGALLIAIENGWLA